ncbi:MAG: 7-carboxy-7-deazaguanine synthase QueE [Endomicrobiales bacterium]|nr:7-carboxy-7-deazaguanine synthase QueE [Endomicrobiales bacterium]
MPPKIRQLKLPVSEIFASFQGEGLYAGQPQIFVRFCGCNLRCDYCDTPENRTIAEKQKFVAISDIVKKIVRFSKKQVFSSGLKPKVVSLTGGEPLLYAGALKILLPALKKRGFKTYLETNGTLPEMYKKLAKWIDIIAMDIKLPSATGEKHWEENKLFLKLSKDRVFVKVVLTGVSKEGEIKKALDITAGISKHIPLVLQPATPRGKTAGIGPAVLHKMFQFSRKKLFSVSILPQMHKFWRVR